MSSIDQYADLIRSYTSGSMGSSDFEREYLRMFKNQDGLMDDNAFSVLDSLFSDVDSFCPNPEIRDESDIDEPTLRSKCQVALDKLDQMMGKSQNEI